jgi:hypothetical protein
MFAANGNPMTVGGVGEAGPFSKVLFLPDLQVRFQQEGATISLPADASIFTVIIPGSPRGVFSFVFDGTFWIYEDATQADEAFFSASPLGISAAVSTNHADNWPMVATISHSGGVQEFLMLHFRLGHLYYTAMLRALQAGTWTCFQHSLQNIHLEQLPLVPPDEEQAPAHLERRPLRPATTWTPVPYGSENGEDEVHQPRALHR